MRNSTLKGSSRCLPALQVLQELQGLQMEADEAGAKPMKVCTC